MEAGSLGSPSSREHPIYYYFFPLEKKLVYFGPVGDELLAGTLGGPWEMVVTSGRAARWP